MIVLVVEGTASGVHRDLIGRSEIFADMLSLPDVPGQDANETFDGYPVVQLQDRKVDFENPLDVFYGRIFLKHLAKYRPFLEFFEFQQTTFSQTLSKLALASCAALYPMT
ncbi:hypothetical protein M422DRAFT_239096 [Sphaerobolus stellatus SS14]|nr:hypothetical protein M422DRAFT_239096 [Sphaerobolus stellatus SS14]